MPGAVYKSRFPLSGRTAGSVGLYTNSTAQYQVAIGGIPFLAAENKSDPMVRQTADWRRQQVDTTLEPGEQSIQAWWLRSQSSFHAGAGIIFQEPDVQDSSQVKTAAYRFADSVGVDPFTTQGKVKLLPSAPQDKSASGGVLVHGATDGNGVDMWLQAEGTALYRCVPGNTHTTVTWGGSGTILSMCDDGTNYYVADATGIYQGTLAGGNGTKIWNTGNASVVIAWVAQRLMAGIGPAIYELISGGTTLPATPNYTHPNSAYVWKSITAGPKGIYFAGTLGNYSEIILLSLDTNGASPVLTNATVVTPMPVGETIGVIYSYLNAYIGIGTSAGIRIGVIQTDGTINLGPLTVRCDLTQYGASAVTSVVGRDRFMYFGWGNGIAGKSGLMCLDLGFPTEANPYTFSVLPVFGKYAFATHLQAKQTGTVTSVSLCAGRLLFGVTGHGSYLESTTALESSGWLQTGNIRFHTLEPKVFKYVDVRCAPLSGGIAVTVNDENGNTLSVGSFTSNGVANQAPLQIDTQPAGQTWVSVRFTFTVSSNPLVGPEFHQYQVRANPATRRQRLIQLPLAAYDDERDLNGLSVGVAGYALQRLLALEALENSGNIVVYQDLANNTSELVMVDKVQFVQTIRPTVGNAFGGLLTVSLRTV